MSARPESGVAPLGLMSSVLAGKAFSTTIVRGLLSKGGLLTGGSWDNSIVNVATGTSLVVLGSYLWNRVIKRISKSIYQVFFEPLNYVVDMETEETRKIRQRKKIPADMPPVYPNGWFKICNSWELAPGQVIQKSLCGKELAVFRAVDGTNEVLAIDLYCPHLGANLAVGGKVDGCALVCPFHNWAFNGKGECVSTGNVPLPMPLLQEDGSYEGLVDPIPLRTVCEGTPACSSHPGKHNRNHGHNGSECTTDDEDSPASPGVEVVKESKKGRKVPLMTDCGHDHKVDPSLAHKLPGPITKAPVQANSKTYHVEERNSMIWLWHHAEGIPPAWELPDVPAELAPNTHGRTLHHIYCHIQEIPENGPDAAHLNVVHRDMNGTSGALLNVWSALWRPATEEEGGKHRSVFRVQHINTVKLLGVLPLSQVDVHGQQIGPGIVYFDFQTIIGKFAIIQTVTPVGPLHQEVEHVIYTPSYLPRFVAKFFLTAMVLTLEQDVPIWNCKTFLTRPTIVKNDGPILQFRRWFSQFYTEHSVKFEDCEQRSLEW